MNRITAKLSVQMPFEILMKEEDKRPIVDLRAPEREVKLYPPPKVEKEQLKQGRFGANIRLDVTLDIDEKPLTQAFDQYFIEHGLGALSDFLVALWLQTGSEDLDPLAPPLYLRCDYYDAKGNPFTNPDTGVTYFEYHGPHGAVISKTEWEQLATNLQRRTAYSFSRYYILRSKKALRGNSFPEAVLLAALACEVSVKEAATRLAQQRGLPDKFWRTVVEDIRPNVMTYFDDIIQALGADSLEYPKRDKKTAKALRKNLFDLFKYRNRIAHLGRIEGLERRWMTADEQRSLAEHLIKIAEEAISWAERQIKGS
jgi:hypothetical protein